MIDTIIKLITIDNNKEYFFKYITLIISMPILTCVNVFLNTDIILKTLSISVMLYSGIYILINTYFLFAREWQKTNKESKTNEAIKKLENRIKEERLKNAKRNYSSR